MKLSLYFRGRQNPVYLLFWPVFILRYLLIENIHPKAGYYEVWCPLDDHIPFLEGFLIPYALWYFCLVGVHLWLFFRNDPAFIRYSEYLILAVAISTAVFLLFPTCQNLRPNVAVQGSLLGDMVQLLYQLDTNTNVCPSEHVIGSAGFFMAVCCSEGSQMKHKILFLVLAVMTAVSTVFLKQHSVVDVLAAIPVSLLAWNVAFRRTEKSREKIERPFCRRMMFGKFF